ncbi:MAG: TldD/PmbA family protein, partial [Clostridia bacterium]|nr:TldD/PmbA family protein [Clostridia bacterium]
MIAQEVIDCALATGGDFAELFFEDRLDNTVAMRTGKVESVNSNRIHGAGVRVYLGFRGVYVYTNDTSREGLLACARRAASALHADARLTAQPLKAHEYVNNNPIAILPSAVKTARKIEKMRAAQAVMSAYPEVVQSMINYKDSEQRVWIANSDGLFTSDVRVYTRMYVTAVASNGAENQTGGEGPGALMGFESFDQRIDPEAAAKKAAERAVTMLHAPVCPAGVMPVVIDNGFGGVIFHEACGHSLEATSVATGASEFSGKLGQMIAAPCVTAV